MKSNLRVRYELDESGWWVASIDAVPGCHTQGRTIEQARERIREALAALTSDKTASRAKLEYDVRLPPAAKKALDLSASKRAVAARLAAEAEDAVRDAAAILSKSMSLRDVGSMLGVSRQRAHQLVEDPRRKSGPVGKSKESLKMGDLARPKKARVVAKPARSQKSAS